MPAYKDEKQGTYYAAFYYTDFTGAKRKKMKRGFARKRDALEWERQFLLQKNADLDMRFGDFVEIYRTDKKERIREHTWESKDNMIDTKILPYSPIMYVRLSSPGRSLRKKQMRSGKHWPND